MSNPTSASFHVPTHPLLGQPCTHWDPHRQCYIRKSCAYCLHGNYKWAEEAVTGRFFCAGCTKKHGFEVKAHDHA